MCGIAGIMTTSGENPNIILLELLSEALAHRGPDGIRQAVSNGVGLAHSRLSIIDLEGGDQPFYASNLASDEKTSLIANGEIYNYVELKLEMSRVEFQTRSDCETPLHLYLRHGLKFARYLRGMYAIAIHDPIKDCLVLARDPFGIKPLYYAETELGFIFASEPQALFQANLIKPKLCEDSRDEFLQLQFNVGAKTIYDGVYRLLPGETLQIKRGRITDRLREDLLSESGPLVISEEAALKRLDKLLNNSVDIHQRSDVPYGMFLSGGIDSSVILALMARLNDSPVQAFTAGFSGENVTDERDHARYLAKTVGAIHNEIEFSEDDFWSLLPACALAMDDPAADYAMLPTFKLGSVVRDAGLKVVLTGEGGDELFGGYGRYRRACRPRIFGGRAMRERGIFDGLGVLRQNSEQWRKAYSLTVLKSQTFLRTRLQSAQAVDCADWLPNDLLTKLDRCLMANGVEGRVPLLDIQLAKFAFSLPDCLKVRRRRGKWLLRKWLSSSLPSSKPFTGKRGFTVPVGNWIGKEGCRLGPLVAKQSAIQEICDKKAVESLFKATNFGNGKKVEHAAWILLFYAVWHRSHIEGLKVDGSVFDVLGD
jgi:asparagine synthase (glutamine-hydrolysing)